jgi:hypothetical protein
VLAAEVTASALIRDETMMVVSALAWQQRWSAVLPQSASVCIGFAPTVQLAFSAPFLRALAWKTPVFSWRAVPNTPNAS